MARTVPAQLNSLPTFTYTRAAPEVRPGGRGRQPFTTGRVTKHKSVSRHEGRKNYVYRVTENMIDPARWEDEEAPEDWPTGPQHPQDLLKAVLYADPVEPESSGASKTSKKGGGSQQLDYELFQNFRRCERCKNSAERISQLCTCTSVPQWIRRNTVTWQQRNIDLRSEDAARGVGAYALSVFQKGEYIAEYQGELIPPYDTRSRYMFVIDNHTETTIGYIDSLRLGNWTRFINHSCNPNAAFYFVRLGSEAKIIIRPSEMIEKDTEITVDYGEKYWFNMNRIGVWCRCGDRNACKWYEGNKTRPKRTGRTGRTGKGASRGASKTASNTASNTAKKTVSNIAKKTVSSIAKKTVSNIAKKTVSKPAPKKSAK